MARPVNPERNRARRLQIIDAGLTVIARHGYTGATTAAICREAGIGSGTFFHYFPTKDHLLVAILREGEAATRAFFAAQDGRTDARVVLHDYIVHAVSDLRDPRASGFISAIAGPAMGTEVIAALQRLDQDAHSALTAWTREAQRDGQVRRDLSAERIAWWILALVDGFASQVGSGRGFDAEAEEPVLYELTARFLSGR